jgi:integrase
VAESSPAKWEATEEEPTMKLTDSIVNTLQIPPGKSELFAWDDSLPGFGVRLRGGTRRWYCQYRVGQQQRRESLGDVRRIKIEAARKIARARFAAVELGADPAADRQKAKADAVAALNTLGVVADRYLVAKKGVLRPSSYAAARLYMSEHWQALRPLPIADIKRADVAAVLQEISASRGRISAARARANLSALFTWAIREGLCDVNPVAATGNPEAGIQSRERVLSDAELRLVWGACQDDAFGRIVRLLVLTGCRRSEVGDLHWSELDFDAGGVMTIPGARTKGKRPLILTLPPAAIEILLAVPRRDGQKFVFGGKSSKAGFVGYAYALMRLNARITAAAGKPLAPWTLHDVRRTMRSGLGKIGIRPDISEMVIGHSKQGVEAIYDRYQYASEIKTALLRWAEYVAGIVEGRATNVVPMMHA